MEVKTYIIYNDFSKSSKKNMKECLRSFDETWNASPHNGCDPSTIHEYEKRFGIQRKKRTKKYLIPNKNISKKSCFYSHYELWERGSKTDTLTAIVEHDTECCSPFPHDMISEVLEKYGHDTPWGIQFTTASVLKNLELYRIHYDNYKKYNNGVHRIFYTHPHGKKYFAGGTGYMLNRAACEWVVNDCKENGWQQNDLLFSDSEEFPLFFIKPSPINYVPEKELHLSRRFKF